MKSTSLVKTMSDLSIKFGEHKYNEYLLNKQIKLIPDDRIMNAIEEMYNKHELFDFLRCALKEMLQDKYNPVPVEEIIKEINENDLSIKERLYTEISLKQNC